MSTTTAIDHLAVRWRTLAAGLSNPGRFERLSRALADGSLDAAFDVEAGGSEVVCVRAIEVPPVRVAADVTDDELLGKLAAAIAASVETALSDARGRDATVVRYHARAHAALDVAVSLSRGDHSREWAWRQLGLWPATGEPAAAGEHLATALAEEPGTLPGLLSAAAEAGALASLASLLGPGRLDGLVRAAWSAGGFPLPDWTDVLGPGVQAPDDADFARAMAILARGALGRMLLTGVELPPQSVTAASAAALLDGEPSLVLQPVARVMRLVTSAALVSLGRSGRHADGAGKRSGLPVPGGREAAQLPPAGTGEIDAGACAPEASASRAAAPEASASDASAGSGERSGVATEFGGLPYLLHLVGRCGLPERAANGEPADAGLARVLYEIGTRILERLLGTSRAPDPEDAALACLCGLAPIVGWRSGLDPGELAAATGQLIDGGAERLIAALRAALEPSELAAGPEKELLTAVCRRRGIIVAEPGWIDIHLDLVEVSTDVRRAGLDLDLGYRPWLGCVVRFVYG